MRVKVKKTAYLDDSLRHEGDVFEWSYNGEILPDCVEKADEPVNETDQSKTVKAKK